MSDSSMLAGVNLANEFRHLKYREEAKDKRYAVCSVCNNGILMLGRDQSTLILSDLCWCCLCGQGFVVDDIEEIRSKDWVSGGEKGVAIDVNSVGLDRDSDNGG